MSNSFTSAEQKNNNSEQIDHKTQKSIDNSKDQDANQTHNKSITLYVQKSNQTILNINNLSHIQTSVFQQSLLLFQSQNLPQQLQNERAMNLSKNKCEQDQSFLSNNKSFQIESNHQQECTSKIYEQIQTQDDSSGSNCLKTFLNVNQNNYRPHILCLKILFQKLKEHSTRSLQNIKLCMSYFQIKIKQQIQSLKCIDDSEVLFECIQQNQVNRQKSLINLIKQSNKETKQKRKQFCNHIKQVYEKLLSVWIKIQQKRSKRQKYIEEQILSKIQAIQAEMCETIKNRLLSQRQKDQNPQILIQIKAQKQKQEVKDRYLQIKHLMNKQNEYLKLLSDFNAKIITYVISMFSKEQILILKEINDALQSYTRALTNCYGESNSYQSYQQEPNLLVQYKQQLADLLQDFIPKDLYYNHHNKGKQMKLQEILLNFSSNLQNTIFLATIEMNNQFILFKNQAIWKTGKPKYDRPSYIDYQAQSTQRRPSPHLFPELNFGKDMKIVVVLTSNHYLHFQHQEYIATVKLNHLKITKKGREIKLGYRQKGIGGFFGMKTQLGRLQFQTNDQVDIFVQKVEFMMKKLFSF